MNNQWVSGLMGVLIAALMLTGCTEHNRTLDPSFTASYVGKPHKLTRDVFLIQQISDWGWIPTAPEHLYFVIPTKPGTTRYIEDENGETMDIPTLREYWQNHRIWQSWQERFRATKYRIVGVVRAGTWFQIVQMSPDNFGRTFGVTLRIESGPFRGKQGIYDHDYVDELISVRVTPNRQWQRVNPN